MLVSAPIDDGGGDHLFLHDIPGPLDRTIGVNSNFMQVFIIGEQSLLGFNHV